MMDLRERQASRRVATQRVIVGIVILAIIGFLAIKHLTRNTPIRFSYELTPQGRSLLRNHMIAFDSGGDIYLATASSVRKVTDPAFHSTADPYSEYTTASAPALSPDGRWLTFCGDDEELFVVPTEGHGKFVDLSSTSDSTQPSWDVSSRSILVAEWPLPPSGLTSSAFNKWLKDHENDPSQIFRVSLNGRASLVAASVNDLSNPVWSPSGSRIAYVSRRHSRRAEALSLSQPGAVWAMRGDGTGRKRLFAFKGFVDNVTWMPDGHHLQIITFGPPLFRDRRWLVDTTTGLVSALGNGTAAPTYSPDGSIAARETTEGIVITKLAPGKGPTTRPVLVIAAATNRKPSKGKRLDPFDGTISAH